MDALGNQINDLILKGKIDEANALDFGPMQDLNAKKLAAHGRSAARAAALVLGGGVGAHGLGSRSTVDGDHWRRREDDSAGPS
jgi:hypothetical protein